MNSGPVVAPDHLRRSAASLDYPLERLDCGVGADSSSDRRRECFAGVLVGDGQDLDRPAVGGAVADEVDCPHLIGTRRDQLAGHPWATALALGPDRQPQPFVAPEPLHALAITGPAFTAEDRMDAPIAIARVAPGEQLQPLPQQRFLRHQPPLVALRRAMLRRDPTRATLGNPEATLQMPGGSASTLRAQKFPRATSRSMSMSSACSPTIRFNRAFSFSSCFRRTTSSGRTALNCARQR